MKYDLAELMHNDGFVCPSCGRRHFGGLRDCVIRRDAVRELPCILEKYGAKKPFLLCDRDTFRAAGERVEAAMEESGISHTVHVIERKKPAPDERIVGEAVMYCPPDADAVVAVGSGVLNDTG